MFDLSAIDALDFLTGRTFYVPSEFEDLMARSSLAQNLDRHNRYAREVADTLARLQAFLTSCQQCPINDAGALMMSYIHLAPLGLDRGENELCYHLPLIDESVLVTADVNAVRQIKAGPPSVSKVYHGRILCFEELMYRVLDWKPYDDLKANLYSGRWRRDSLRNAFHARGPATTEEEFRASISASAKSLAAEFAPFLVCSWP